MSYKNTSVMEAEVAEPMVAYGASRKFVEPWMSAAADFDDEEELPAGWDDELLNDPEIRAEIFRRDDEVNAQIAAGTLVTYSTEEVLAAIRQEFQQIWGLQNV